MRWISLLAALLVGCAERKTTQQELDDYKQYHDMTVADHNRQERERQSAEDDKEYQKRIPPEQRAIDIEWMRSYYYYRDHQFSDDEAVAAATRDVGRPSGFMPSGYDKRQH